MTNPIAPSFPTFRFLLPAQSAKASKAGQKTRRTAEQQQAPTALEAEKAALIEAIQHGYIAEDSGKRVTLPRFARASMIALIENGDA